MLFYRRNLSPTFAKLSEQSTRISKKGEWLRNGMKDYVAESRKKTICVDNVCTQI